MEEWMVSRFQEELLVMDEKAQREMSDLTLAVHQEKGPAALLTHPSEAFCAVKVKLKKLPLLEGYEDEHVTFCSTMLNKVSRSFSTVIRLLPENLRLEICLFYIILRALDTIEDDMEAFEGKLEEKKEMLASFHKRLLGPPPSLPVGLGKYIIGVGEGDEATLLEQFDRVLLVWHNHISPENQEIIRVITEKMANGMVEFCGRDMSKGTTSCAEYDLYCHYVAGLVGQGLTSLFVQSGHEDVLKDDTQTLDLANTMGLFLQKTNIIRDFAEDLLEGRTFWPREIWGKHVYHLSHLIAREERTTALNCLNDMICNAMELLPGCLKYMSLIKNEGNFRFCAIPQVMAMATMSLCYNNPDVFTGAVKIRKGLAASILCMRSHEEFLWWIDYFAREMRKKVVVEEESASDSNADRMMLHLDNAFALTGECNKQVKMVFPWAPVVIFFLALLVTIVSLVRHPHRQ